MGIHGGAVSREPPPARGPGGTRFLLALVDVTAKREIFLQPLWNRGGPVCPLPSARACNFIAAVSPEIVQLPIVRPLPSFPPLSQLSTSSLVGIRFFMFRLSSSPPPNPGWVLRFRYGISQFIRFREHNGCFLS